MKNGIYKASFQTPIGQGFGIVVVSDGTLKGGDSSMYYVGTFEETENHIKASLRIHKHSNVTGIISALGVDNANLKVEGTSTETSANVKGRPDETPNVEFQALLELIE